MNFHRAALTACLFSLIACSCSEQQQVVTRRVADLHPAALLSTLMTAPDSVQLIDLRDADAFASFHLPGAVRMDAADALRDAVGTPANREIVLCGEAHQAITVRDQLRTKLAGTSVRALGCDVAEVQQGWLMKPPGLMKITTGLPYKFDMQRAFLMGAEAVRKSDYATDPDELQAPTVVSPQWLHAHRDEVSILDVRSVPEVEAFHIPGAVQISVRDLRNKTGEAYHLMKDHAALAARFGQAGLTRDRAVVIVYGQRLLDATFAATALFRLGHQRLAILDGGMLCWASWRLPLRRGAAPAPPTTYQPTNEVDEFAVAIDAVKQASEDEQHATLLLDARPQREYQGTAGKSARRGHIPNARNRPFESDLLRERTGVWLLPRAELAAAYEAKLDRRDQPIITCCRTGHAATQSYFVLRHLLHFEDVRYYNGSWIEWSQRDDLPVETGPERPTAR